MTARSSSENTAQRARGPLLAGVVLAVAGVAALAVDLPVARWFIEQRCHPLLVKLVSLAEVMAHGIGAAMLLVTVAALDATRIRSLARLATMSLGAGVVANCMKLILARRRPFHFDFQGGSLATFGDWFTWGSGGSGTQSFLSSHAAVAAGMAAGLAWLYPRGKWLFFLYGALAMTQRLVACAHFTSDVLWGAAVGAFWTAACLSPRFAGNAFDAFETGSWRRNPSADDDRSADESPSQPGAKAA